MNRKSRYSGFTLVEVIVSLVIISTVIITLVSFFGNGFDNIFGLRQTNKMIYAAQENIEEQMADAKENGANGNEKLTFTYRVGSNQRTIDVDGKILVPNRTDLEKDRTLDLNNETIKDFKLFVSNQKEAVIDLPSGLSVRFAETPQAYYYVGEKVPNGIAELPKDLATQVNQVRSSWFQSYQSVQGPNGEELPLVGSLDSTAVEAGSASQVLRPNLNEDFKVYSSMETGFTITNDMRGKFLSFAGRVVSTYGRVGAYQEATPRIWVLGLPLNKSNGLVAHTDADLAMLLEDGAKKAVPTAGHQGISEDSFTNTVVENHVTRTAYSSTVPIKSVYSSNMGQARQFITLNNNQLQFSNVNLTNGWTTSLLLGNQTQAGNLLTYQFNVNSSWILKLDNAGNVSVQVTDSTGANVLPEQRIGNISYLADHSIQVRSVPRSGSLVMEVWVDNTRFHQYSYRLNSGRVSHTINRAAITFAGNTYINEFAIFNRNLSDDELTSLHDYFVNKFKAK